MHATPQPNNEVFAFSGPIVKGTEVEFGLRVASGLAVMRAGRSLALDFARALAGGCGFNLVAKADAPAKRRRGGRAIDPEKRARYVAAYRDVRDGKLRSLAAAAVVHGCTYHTLVNWVRAHQPELNREIAAASAPVLKPGGQIL